MAKKDFSENLKKNLTGFDPGKLMTIPAEAPEPGEKPQRKKKAVSIDRQAQLPTAGMLSPDYIERRTRRVQIVLSPSLYEKAENRYKALGFRSFNDYVNKLLQLDTDK